MHTKTIAILSYVTLIGWIIAYLQYRKATEKSALCAYHLEQGLGVIIFAAVLGIILNIIAVISSALAGILSLLALIPLIFIILGVIAANNESLTPVPLIGKFFEGKFRF